MIKIYPSSFATPVGHTTDSKYNKGCIRYQVFKDDLTIEKTNIHPMYQAIGTLGEAFIIAKLEGEKVVFTDIEKPFKYQLDDDFYISGRFDAACSDYIYEFKTSISKVFYSTIIRKGVINPDHLGQLITYLCVEERTKGKLICAYAHFDKKLTSLKFETREFDVEICDGDIFVDNEPYGASVTDLMKFYANVVQAHKDPAFPPATINDNACNYCPLADLCAFGPKVKAEFSREVAKIEGVEEIKREPKIQIHNCKEIK